MTSFDGDAWGIDFGTTNSALFAYIGRYGSQPSSTNFDDAGKPVPSVVAIDRQSGIVFVGREAKRRYLNNPRQYAYIHSVKTVLEDDSWRLEVAGRVLRPVDVAAEIFRKLKDLARERQYHVNRVVVAVPNGASGKKRARIYEAAKIAGLTVRQFVTEPLAAFFANFNHLRNERYVAVFDWGGGTLDITVLENRADGKIVELSKAGLQEAGDELNVAIAREIHRRLVDLRGLEKSFAEMPSIDRERLVEQCEKAKCGLSEKEEEVVALMDYGGLVVNESLTRRQMGDVIRPYVRRALELLSKVIAESKLTKEDIGKVLIVGGSSRLLDVREGIERMFAGAADKILKPKDAEWNVAKGAGRLDYRKGEYFSAEDIGVILGDENKTFYPLLHGYFSTSPNPLSRFCLASSFGIMDTTEYPRIVFAARDAEGRKRVLDSTVVARAYRFLTEAIEMDVVVNEALVFCARVRSGNTTDANALYWEYPDLRLVYEAPTFGV